MRFLAVLGLLVLAACSGRGAEHDRPAEARDFPQADRPVSRLGERAFSTEITRDDLKEASIVMDLAEVQPGMTVADIGAGEGYYTVRLARRVGPKGRVLAGDIDEGVIERLAHRVERDRLDNVSVQLGTPEDPKLPPGSFDRIFLVHMYQEVREPYAFLWHLQPALRPGGKVIVVNVDRPTDQNGISPALLICEFSALGFHLTRFARKSELQGYYAQFVAAERRPPADEIVPCRIARSKAGT